jgi:hypothetical protein
MVEAWEAGGIGKINVNLIGYHFNPAVKCMVCDVHTICVATIVQGQEDAPQNLFCSPQYSCCFNGDRVDNGMIRKRRE